IMWLYWASISRRPGTPPSCPSLSVLLSAAPRGHGSIIAAARSTRFGSVICWSMRQFWSSAMTWWSFRRLPLRVGLLVSQEKFPSVEILREQKRGQVRFSGEFPSGTWPIRAARQDGWEPDGAQRKADLTHFLCFPQRLQSRY